MKENKRDYIMFGVILILEFVILWILWNGKI